MDTEEITLANSFTTASKKKGISLKKLSDMTGISMNHIENMLRGDFENVPPTPYFRGYLIRLGEVLNFDGEAWWEKIKREEGVGTSGPADALPKNRFIRKSPAKMIAIRDGRNLRAPYRLRSFIAAYSRQADRHDRFPAGKSLCRRRQTA